MAKKNSKAGAGLGVALGAAALASAGAYFLYGSKHAKQNRQKVKSWALKAKAEVLEQVEKVKELDMDQYKAMVDGVLERYYGAQGATQREVQQLAKELKDYWLDMEKSAAAKKRSSTTKARSARTRKQNKTS